MSNHNTLAIYKRNTTGLAVYFNLLHEKFLILALQRVSGDIVLTKTCNDLLPNHAKLYKEKQHSDDKCTL